uniref:Uncharacterized protein n=1 Tax=Rhizophora mucronata TaxID=61149 RepID=A0A2P2NMT7_RHIMU
MHTHIHTIFVHLIFSVLSLSLETSYCFLFSQHHSNLIKEQKKPFVVWKQKRQ